MVPRKITLKSRDQKLGHATAFFYKYNECFYLISNWHVFSGRNCYHSQPIHDSCAVPDQIEFNLSVVGAKGAKIPLHVSILSRTNIDLNDDAGRPIWLQHREGQKYDLAAYPVPNEIIADREIFPAVGTNDAPHLSIRPGSEVFILGYPMGITLQSELPIWKRGSVASEPAYHADGLPIILVDTATRKGMSGSPVFAVTSRGLKWNKNKTSIVDEALVKFLGVYSGRYGADDEFAAQIGRVWNRSVLDEMLSDPIPGSHNPPTSPKRGKTEKID